MDFSLLLYKKNYLSIYNKVVQAILQKGKVIYGKRNKIHSHIRDGCANIISSSHLSRDEKVIYYQYREDIRDIIKQLCSYKGVQIIEGHVMPDHVHILVSILPKMIVSSFMGYLKGKSAQAGFP